MKDEDTKLLRCFTSIEDFEKEYKVSLPILLKDLDSCGFITPHIVMRISQIKARQLNPLVSFYQTNKDKICVSEFNKRSLTINLYAINKTFLKKYDRYMKMKAFS